MSNFPCRSASTSTYPAIVLTVVSMHICTYLSLYACICALTSLYACIYALTCC
ncbi:hypothetical protein C8Q73DRAFT_698866, partial [Cubamyces lactineus]